MKGILKLDTRQSKDNKKYMNVGQQHNQCNIVISTGQVMPQSHHAYTACIP